MCTCFSDLHCISKNSFQCILDESSHKPNNLWLDKGNEFSDRLMKIWLQNNDTEIYWIHNEGIMVSPKDLLEH